MSECYSTGYGICVSDGSSSTDKVFMTQKRIIRSLADASLTDSCRPLYKLFKIFTFNWPSTHKNQSILIVVHRTPEIKQILLSTIYEAQNICAKAPTIIGVKIFPQNKKNGDN